MGKKKQREKEEKEARERREAELAKEPETPEHKIEVDQDIQVVEISTPHGTESVAETVARRIVATIEMPLVSNPGDIDADIVDCERLEVEVPGVYWLDVMLPHPVDDEAMECTFSKETQTLKICVPALPE